MAQENIRFPRAHMAIRDEFFYYCDERNDTLNIKVCDGDNVFIYPFEVPLGANQVKALEYDGTFFWTLQHSTNSIDSVIKKWVIDNYTCKLVTTVDLYHTSEDNFSCDTFALEYYNTTLSGTVSVHDTQVTITSNYDKVEPGTVLTIGPNTEGLYEDVTVTGTLNNEATFGLDFYIFNEYLPGTKVYFTKSLWLINDYYHKQLSGGLYEISFNNAGGTSTIIPYEEHWDGDHTNKKGRWEYTIASNVFLMAGLYSCTFDAYDNDSSGEMGLRVDNSEETIDILATNTGDNQWLSQTGEFKVTTADYYDIKGRQHQDASYNWGIDNVDIWGVSTLSSKGEIKTVLQDEDFKSVIASCFYNTGTEQYFLYVVDTALRFFNINTKLNETSMLMDNRRVNNTTITVQDIQVEGETLYRLQDRANYYGTDYSWSTYNYQPSTVRPFIDSVTIDVNPKILPSNGINVAEITVSVRDQYNDPIKLKTVFLEDSSATGFITTAEVYTNALGVATGYYKAGTVPESVILRATATQYD